MARSKEEIHAAAEALFKDIDAEFGKKEKKKPVMKNATPKPPVVSEGMEANRMAELMSANSNWKAVAVVAIVVVQTCKCCHGDTEYIGNTLIRHVHKVTKIQWDHQLPEAPEHVALPHEVETFYQDVEQCPTCVRFNMFQMDLASTIQLSLFH